MIPLLCRLQESEQPLSSTMFASVEQRIASWSPPKLPAGPRWAHDHLIASRAYQTALKIYLRYVFYRRSTKWTAFVEQTQPLILEYFSFSTKLAGLPAATTMMCSFLIVASFCKGSLAQGLICSAFKEAGYEFEFSDRAIQVLKRTWSISTEDTYGIDALDIAVKELDFCMG